MIITNVFLISVPQKNGTDDGNYTIYSGTEDVDNLGTIKSWNGVRLDLHTFSYFQCYFLSFVYYLFICFNH